MSVKMLETVSFSILYLFLALGPPFLLLWIARVQRSWRAIGVGSVLLIPFVYVVGGAILAFETYAHYQIVGNKSFFFGEHTWLEALVVFAIGGLLCVAVSTFLSWFWLPFVLIWGACFPRSFYRVTRLKGTRRRSPQWELDYRESEAAECPR